MEWWEWWIGDAAYDRCAGVVTRFKQQADCVLEQWQVWWNKSLNRPRQRVEHTMRQVKCHQMWQSKARNSEPVIHAAMKLTVHLTNIHIKKPWVPGDTAWSESYIRPFLRGAHYP